LQSLNQPANQGAFAAVHTGQTHRATALLVDDADEVALETDKLDGRVLPVAMRKHQAQADQVKQRHFTSEVGAKCSIAQPVTIALRDEHLSLHALHIGQRLVEDPGLERRKNSGQM